MGKTSIVIDDITRKMLDDYCTETGKQLSEAIRGFISQGLGLYKTEKELGYKEAVGPNGLMINQKYAIRASIEGVLLLRKLTESLLKDQTLMNEIDAEASSIIKSGWEYDNQS